MPANPNPTQLPDEYVQYLELFCDHLWLEKRLSKNTVSAYRVDLRIFFEYLCAHGISPLSFTTEDLRNMLHARNEQQYNANSTIRCFHAISGFLKFLKLTNLRSDNPLEGIELPRQQRALPVIMSEDTVAKFLECPNTNTFVGLRDKAMLELLYATGVRVSELCELKLENYNQDEGVILVKGKGSKERLLPVTKLAMEWIEQYLVYARPMRDPEGTCPYIFLSVKTQSKDSHIPRPMTRTAFWYRIHCYSTELGMTTPPSPHSFRHAFATHLLNHDADLISLQSMLGHSSLSTTQIYTHVALARMHKIYDAAHPRA